MLSLRNILKVHQISHRLQTSGYICHCFLWFVNEASDKKEPGLPESLNCWLSDESSGLELTTEAEQEPLSNPSIEKGTAADCSW